MNFNTIRIYNLRIRFRQLFIVLPFLFGVIYLYTDGYATLDFTYKNISIGCFFLWLIIFRFLPVSKTDGNLQLTNDKIIITKNNTEKIFTFNDFSKVTVYLNGYKGEHFNYKLRLSNLFISKEGICRMVIRGNNNEKNIVFFLITSLQEVIDVENYISNLPDYITSKTIDVKIFG